jgi:hypothetical protein
MKQTLNFEMLNAYLCLYFMLHYMLLESILFGPELLSSRFFLRSDFINSRGGRLFLRSSTIN